MDIWWPLKGVVQLLTLSSFAYFLQVPAQYSDADFPTADINTSWENNNLSIVYTKETSDTNIPMMRNILLKDHLDESFTIRFACGFFYMVESSSFIFAIAIVQTTDIPGAFYSDSKNVKIVWSANRNNPVGENATVQLTAEGDLILRGVNGGLVWSTQTANKSVLGMKLTEEGNLVLFNRHNATVWQSFDHPTDSLLPGQKLMEGQSLIASVSASNYTQGGLFTLSVTSNNLLFNVSTDPPQYYYKFEFSGFKDSKEPSYVTFLNGSLSMFMLFSETNKPDYLILVPPVSAGQYMKLDSDGHLRVYGWVGRWIEVADLLKEDLKPCDYPMACGNYGICSNGQCTCPEAKNSETRNFRLLNDRQPELGCSEITPLSCKASQYHNFLHLTNVASGIANFDEDLHMDMDMESCKEKCLKNCSCKAAMFQHDGNALNGNCFLLSQVFWMTNFENEDPHYNLSSFIKVQISPNKGIPDKPSPLTPFFTIPPSEASPHAPPRKKTRRIAIIVGSVAGASLVVFVIISVWAVLLRKKKDAEDEEDYLDQVPGMPMKFSYEDLKIATDDFCQKLGQGGFGSVFQGILSNGTKVAVKRLVGLSHIKKSFLAEVETIGSIHHVNLVRLIGFCTEKSNRLLVYEYMSNGSLDKWIFHRNQQNSLDWQTRRKVIVDIAKGLTYLHEECRQRIIHLDIKPQNILLDDNLNAKVSDFGLSKLINRDESKVVMTMRSGTPGYLAPEWLSSVITEKVDVYSFGVVVMEIVCGRKNLDHSQPEENMHLLSLVERKAKEDELFDLVDKQSNDVQLHIEAAVKMMKVAAWCLQSDFASRPSMSTVVKVLEGVLDVEPNLDYSFSTPPQPPPAHKVAHMGFASVISPSVLSGPR